jgi:hypothetical protein
VDTQKQAEVGSHYLVIYPDMPTFRTIYSNYAKSELEEDSNELVVILPCYETTYGVRKILSEVLDVKKRCERRLSYDSELLRFTLLMDNNNKT